jgi:hypothetical protein
MAEKMIRQRDLISYLVTMKELAADDLLATEEDTLEAERMLGIYETYLHLVEKFGDQYR